MSNIIFLYGPPAVGKLTVAKVLAEKTEYKLLHNHLIVNPIAEIFPFENPSNRLLTREFRIRILDEAIKSDINIITTFGIAGNNPFKHIDDVVKSVKSLKGNLLLVQLTADKETLLNRVENQSRKDHGKNTTKEYLETLFNENSETFSKYPNLNHLTINTREISPEQAIDRIIEYYQIK